MKQSILLQSGTLFIVLASLAFCKPHDPEPDTVVQRQDTLSIANVRSLATSPIPSSIQITDAGREGVFKLDEADLSSNDNTGVTLVTSKGHRYKRDYSGPANLFWFGDTSANTDIGPILEAAIQAVSELVIPDGNYTQLTEAHLKSNITIRANPGKVLITLSKSYVSLVNPKNPDERLDHIVLDGLSWNVTSQESGPYGPIYIDGPSVSNFTVQNCSSTDVAAKDSTNWMTLKIQAGKTADKITVQNNVIQAKRMGCEIFNHDNVNVYAGTNILVSGNTFHECHFGLSLSGPLDGLTIDNNYVKNCSLFGIEVAGAARNVRITNNKFEGVFDKFLEGSNDGNGNGSVVGGMQITGNVTVGLVQGGMQLYNGGTVVFSKNNFRMTGMIELTHSTAGGTFTENVIESSSSKAIICDNSPNNTFRNNTISNKPSPGNQATFLAYGSKATNNILTNNTLIKGSGGKYYEVMLGGTFQATMNYDEAGNLIP
ncbi:hypothetical protein GCM10027592_32330 [Spirosoma flavus]